MGGAGKGGGGASAAAGTQADIARKLFAETGPLRDLLFGGPGTPGTPGTPGRMVDVRDPFGPTDAPIFTTVFQPGLAATPGTPGSPGLLQNLLTQPSGVFPAERDTLESQFGRAREGILAGVPARGGTLQSLLAQHEISRAIGVTGLESMGQARQQENIFRTLGGITGQTQVSMGGLGSAGNIFAQQQQAQLGLAGNLGLGAGLAAGSMKGAGAGAGTGAASAGAAGGKAVPVMATAGACWIARALYGRRSVEATLARFWIFTEWQGPVANVVRFLYRRFGRRIARWRWALLLLRPAFDLAVQKAGQ